MMFRKESENRKDSWVSTGEDRLSLKLSPGALRGHTELRAPLSSLDNLEQMQLCSSGGLRPANLYLPPCSLTK